MRARILPWVAGLALIGQEGCGPSEGIELPGIRGRTSVVELDPGEAGFTPAAGQVLYVPVYSTIYIADQAADFNLAVTLCVRNVDRNRPIVLTAVSYRDQDGTLVREYLKRPIRIGPLASVEFFVGESDTGGGISPSFLVEWKSAAPASSPLVQAVMAGTSSAQGVSFTTEALVIEDLGPKSGIASPEPVGPE